MLLFFIFGSIRVYVSTVLVGYVSQGDTPARMLLHSWLARHISEPVRTVLIRTLPLPYLCVFQLLMRVSNILRTSPPKERQTRRRLKMDDIFMHGDKFRSRNDIDRKRIARQRALR